MYSEHTKKEKVRKNNLTKNESYSTILFEN